MYQIKSTDDITPISINNITKSNSFDILDLDENYKIYGVDVIGWFKVNYINREYFHDATEVASWVVKNRTGNYTVLTYGYYAFEKEEDAVHYTLTWT